MNTIFFTQNAAKSKNSELPRKTYSMTCLKRLTKITPIIDRYFFHIWLRMYCALSICSNRGQKYVIPLYGGTRL